MPFMCRVEFQVCAFSEEAGEKEEKTNKQTWVDVIIIEVMLLSPMQLFLIKQ